MDLTVGRVKFIGPFEHHEVVVDGHLVPWLTAMPYEGGDRVDITLDQRFSLVLTTEEAGRVVPFLADAIAVASGEPCHPRPRHDPPLPPDVVAASSSSTSAPPAGERADR